MGRALNFVLSAYSSVGGGGDGDGYLGKLLGSSSALKSRR